MKLDPKHIIKHLPYNVQVLDLITNKVFTLDVDNLSQTLNDIEHLNSAKLALHTLSDLTKPITHKGETFVPYKRIEDLFDIEDFTTDLEYLIKREDDGNVFISITKQNEITEQLLEWNFDIDNLIGHGFAVDINTLK